MQFIYGLSKSGISLARYLNKKNKNFNCWDDDLNVRQRAKKLLKNIRLVNPKNKCLNGYDEIYVSPGISTRKKNFLKIKNNKIKIARDLNLYWHKIVNQKLVAVTGTNGKSTTTKLIAEIFMNSNISTFVGGNIGTPLFDSFLNKKKYTHHVIELSSFQLELIKDFNPTVSILLNLSKDHLDRYRNFRDYIDQKKKIFSTNGLGFNLISLDDFESMKLFNNKKINNKISFSISNNKADIFYKDNYIYDNYFFNKKRIKIKKISTDLNGIYNYQNILVSYIVSKIFKINLNIFKKTITNFIGLPHRNEIIEKNKKFIAINNSKATNLNATYYSLQNYNDVLLILGGQAKEKNFKKLTKLHKNISKAYIYGKSARLISNQIKSKIYVVILKTLEQVIDKIFDEIKNRTNKIIILFAPACTSFDQYKNFEERGKHFTKLIKKYSKKI